MQPSSIKKQDFNLNWCHLQIFNMSLLSNIACKLHGLLIKSIIFWNMLLYLHHCIVSIFYTVINPLLLWNRYSYNVDAFVKIMGTQFRDITIIRLQVMGYIWTVIFDIFHVIMIQRKFMNKLYPDYTISQSFLCSINLNYFL